MRNIDAQEVTKAVSYLFYEANFFLTDDVLDAIKNARETEESPVARDVLDRILDNAKIAAEEKRSVELVAREERYKIYSQVAQRIKAKRIALGHTADDNAETFFFNLMRGAGFTGLGGIPSNRPLDDGNDVFIIRPLIESTRTEVLEFLREKKEAYRMDSSNLATNYVRNKIRHRLIPLIEKEFNPKIKENITRLEPFFSERFD